MKRGRVEKVLICCCNRAAEQLCDDCEKYNQIKPDRTVNVLWQRVRKVRKENAIREQRTITR